MNKPQPDFSLNKQYNRMIRLVAPDNVKKWNSLAGRVPCTFPLGWVRRWSSVTSKDSVLDYGCGEGRLLGVLVRAGVTDLWGCDASVRMCSLAKLTNSGATIVQADLTKLGSNIGRTFSLVTSIAVLSSIVPRAQRVCLVRALWSILDPGGRLVVADFGVASNRIYKKRYLQSVYEPRTFRTAEGLYVHHFTLTEIVQLLKMCKFDTLETDTIEVTTMHGNQIPGHIVLAKRRP